MKELLGETDYRELIMLEKVKNSEGAAQVAADIKKMERQSGVPIRDSGEHPAKKAKTIQVLYRLPDQNGG
ncbi:hypothetical protein F4802DRAFT_590869, partial [Xylaria palmicola]